jgi:hypothetical protein
VREEVPLEVRVVGDEGAAAERRGDRLRDRLDARGTGEVGGGEARQALDRARELAARLDQGRERREPRLARLEQHRAELDDLGARVAREARRLEVDDGERAVRCEQRGEPARVDAERGGIPLLDLEDVRVRAGARTPLGFASLRGPAR